MKRRKTTFAFLATALLSGCLATSNTTHVAEPHAARVAVAFDTDAAMNTFIEDVRSRYRRGDAELSKSSWGIPFIYGSSERTVLSENAYFNRQIARADLDANGLISDAEADAYVRVER